MIKTRKNKYNFWKRIRFKYRLSAINENTLEEIWKMKVSIFSGILVLLLFATFLITVTSIIIIATPIRYYLPGYLDSEVRHQALRSAIAIDSIEEQVRYQDLYIQNVKKIFAGEIDVDSLNSFSDTLSISHDDHSLQKSQKEKDYVQHYEEEERYNLSILPSPTQQVSGIAFFRPLRGSVISRFSAAENKYDINIKIVAPMAVQAALEGTVMFAGYDINEGYIIQIQHKNGFVSVYKHNTSLLKKVGDRVSTGEAIARIGEKETNPQTHLSFELWYKGTPVNPEDYISF